MTKRLIDIDDELLRDAREALGEATMKDTVTAALSLALQVKAGQETLEMLQNPVVSDLANPEVMRGAWR